MELTPLSAETYDISGRTFTEQELKEKFCFHVYDEKSFDFCKKCTQKCQTIIDLSDKNSL